MKDLAQMAQVPPQSTRKGMFAEWKSKIIGRLRESPVPPVPPQFLAKNEGLAQTPDGDAVGEAAGHAIGEQTRPAPVPVGERWSLADERECYSKCKWCGGAIEWVRVDRVFDSLHPDGRAPNRQERRWFALDPDFSPHGCGTTRLIMSSESAK